MVWQDTGGGTGISTIRITPITKASKEAEENINKLKDLEGIIMGITLDPDKQEEIHLNVYETRLRGQYIFPTGKANEAVKELLGYATHFNFEIRNVRLDTMEKEEEQVLDFILIQKGKSE